MIHIELAGAGVKWSGMKSALVYVGAAIAEIAGCFAFWAWLRLGKPLWWLLPGVLSLIVFAYLLTLRNRRCWPRLRRLWRHLHRRLAVLAVKHGKCAPRSLGYYWRQHLPDWGRGDTLRPSLIGDHSILAWGEPRRIGHEAA